MYLGSAHVCICLCTWKPEVDAVFSITTPPHTHTPCFWRQGFPQSPALPDLARLADQKNPRMLLSPLPWHWDCRRSRQGLTFHVGTENPKAHSRVYAADILPPEASPEALSYKGPKASYRCWLRQASTSNRKPFPPPAPSKHILKDPFVER